ncbi:MAG: hypothetical protein P8Y97_03270 [Candidatus Lokiarchaeota archaeon]
MNENNLSNIILESIYQFGPLAVPEIKYLLKNYFSWKIKLGVETLFKLKNYDISKYLNKLTETRKIREYLCESGYSSRYGISKLPFTSEYPLKLNLKIKLKKCSECSSWIIEYHNKKRHLFYFSCKKRDEIDDGNILFIRYNNKYFTIYNNLFLGVFEEGILRFPFRDYRISSKKYNLISKFLKDYWKLIERELGISEDINNIEKLTKLLEYYDPKRTPATRLKILEDLPNIQEIEEKYDDFKEDLEKMIELGILYLINRINSKFLIITPEGLVFLFALEESKEYTDLYRLNTLIVEKYQKILFEKYREFVFEKFENLQILEKEISPFTNKDIGILLFFLVNGSIGKEQAFTRDIKGSEKALNCIVRTFHKNIELDEEKRNDETIVPIRILQSDLSTLQMKIGYAINNEESTYYIKESEASFIMDRLKETLEEKKQKRNKFLKEYNHWRPLLRQNKICHYDYRIVDKIENFIKEL